MTDYNANQRRSMQKKGQALPNPSGGPPRFPIKTATDVANAVRLIGQIPASQQASVKAYIIRRAKAVPGGTAKIPAAWTK